MFKEWLNYFFGGYDDLLYALFVFVIINYITNIMCSIVEKKVSSEVGLRGIFKKLVIFMLIGVANIIDKQVIDQGEVLRTASIFFFLANEGLAIIENATYLGLPIPRQLKEVLHQLRDKDRKEKK